MAQAYDHLFPGEQHLQLASAAQERNWGLALMLVGWLHLLAFGLCYYLTIALDYHDSAGYLLIWTGEFLGMLLVFRLCATTRISPPAPLEVFVRRVWLTYFILAFNLGTLNTLRGHALFEFFPALASLASFAFIMLSITVHWKFFLAMLVMFSGGLLMAAYFLHAYLIFALAWWVVLEGIGLTLWLEKRRSLIPMDVLAATKTREPEARMLRAPLVKDLQ